MTRVFSGLRFASAMPFRDDLGKIFKALSMFHKGLGNDIPAGPFRNSGLAAAADFWGSQYDE